MRNTSLHLGGAMLLIRAAIVLGVCLVLAGCAIPSERLVAAKVCCQHPREFEYKDMPPKGELEAVIGVDYPVYEFPGGRSYFEALRLAPGAGVLRVHAQRSPPHLSRGYFCASVTFLDERHEPIETRYEPPVVRRYPDGLVSLVADYRVPAGARYAVLHSEEKRNGEYLSFPSEPVYYLGAAVAIMSPKEWRTPCHPIGRLTFSHEDQKADGK